MTSVLWILTVLLCLEPILKIAFIGEPRKPITRSDAVVSLIVNAALVVGIWYSWPD